MKLTRLCLSHSEHSLFPRTAHLCSAELQPPPRPLTEDASAQPPLLALHLSCSWSEQSVPAQAQLAKGTCTLCSRLPRLFGIVGMRLLDHQDAGSWLGNTAQISVGLPPERAGLSSSVPSSPRVVMVLEGLQWLSQGDGGMQAPWPQKRLVIHTLVSFFLPCALS